MVGLPRKSHLTVLVLILTCCVYISSCSLNSSWNTRQSDMEESKASFLIKERGNKENVLFVLASSGGGSRAAYLTASTMLKLQSIKFAQSDLLFEVDAMSAVSGSSLAAGYYAISRDSKSDTCKNSYYTDETRSYARPIWSDTKVRNLMTKNYQFSWFLRWFLPQNLLRFWFTAFDRSDIMTQVYANTLFDRKWSPGDYRFGEICQNRPNLVINATIGSSGNFGQLFTFTEELMNHYYTSVNNYGIANAVMSSSAFPVAFNFTTLRDYSINDHEYLHLFDGGIYDNLGLTSALAIIGRNRQRFDRIVLLLVDAHTNPTGALSSDPDPRSLIDFVADTNLLDSVSVMMNKSRNMLVSAAQDTLESLDQNASKTAIFCHIHIEAVDDEILRSEFNSIKTAFKITDKEAKTIDSVVNTLFADGIEQDLRSVVTGIEKRSGVCKQNSSRFTTPQNLSAAQSLFQSTHMEPVPATSTIEVH